MASILVGTNDLRAGLISVLVHACNDPELPALCRVRLDVGKENITVTATDRFTAGLAIVSVFSHLGYDLEETDIPWAETIDLPADDARKILDIFKAGKDKADEPEYLLRIETTDTHVTVTDSSGMIDGRALKLPRLPADEAFPDLTVLFSKIHHGKPALLEDMAVGGQLLARFKAAAACYREPLVVEATTSSRALMIRCGESFLGSLMPVRLEAEGIDKQKAWRDAWTVRLPLPSYAADGAES